ncbi:MAG: hypothetical protein WAJ93_13825, partial [Candidatus Nitrosopolaris sp.]
HNGILVAATYDSWIKDTSFTGKNFLLGIDSNYGTQIWNYEIPGGVFSSPCLVGGAPANFSNNLGNIATRRKDLHHI